MVSESALITKILAWVREQRRAGVPIKAIKLHGNAYVESGTPDLHITLRGRSFWIEVKKPGGKTTALQDQRLSEWRTAGAEVAVVRSLEELKRLVVP